MSNLVYQGVLYKRRDLFKNQWRPRWFHLDAQTGVLSYLVQETRPRRRLSPRGSFYLRGCTIHKNDRLSKNGIFVFDITSPGGSTTCHLAATSSESREEWIYRLQQVCSVGISHNTESPSSLADSVRTTTSSSNLETISEEREEINSAGGTSIHRAMSTQNHSAGSLPSFEHSLTDGQNDSTDPAIITNLNLQFAQNVPSDVVTLIEEKLDTFLPLCQGLEDWNKSTEHYGVVVFSKKFKGLTMFRSHAVLKHSPRQVLKLLMDLPKRSEFLEPNIRAIHRVQIWNPHTSLDYCAYQAVWPTRARDFSLVSHWRVLETAEIPTIVLLAFSREGTPEEPDHHRADLIVSLYTLESVLEDDGKCGLTRILCTDLGLPTSIQDSAVLQSALIPSAIARYLGEQPPQLGRGNNISNEIIANEDLAHIFDQQDSMAENSSGSPELNEDELIIETSSRSAMNDDMETALISANQECVESLGYNRQPPSLGNVAPILIAPYLLWSMANKLHFPGKEAMFWILCIVALRTVLLKELGASSLQPKNSFRNGIVICRLTVDLKGVLRFIANKKEERDEIGNASTKDEDISVTHIVMKALALALSEFKEIRTKRESICVPLLGINSICSRRCGDGENEDGIGVVLGNGRMSKVFNGSRRTIQEIANIVKASKEDDVSNNQNYKATHLPFLDIAYDILNWLMAGAPFFQIERDHPHLQCLVITSPDSERCQVDVDVANPSFQVSAVVGGVRIVRDPRDSIALKAMLSISLSIQAPVTSVTVCRKFAERVHELVQFPEVCDG